MAGKTRSRVRNEVTRCPNCGEDYSVTYKRCPFCDESARVRSRGSGGKRLNTRGGGYGGGWTPFRVISTLLSVALIAAAVYIVVTQIKPLVELGSGTASPSATVSPSASPSVEPSIEPSQEPSVEPSAQTSSTPAAQTAQSLTLSTEDFTLTAAGQTHRITATLTPAGASGTVSWSSSSTAVATVDANGTVTAVSKGNATITAALENGTSKTCIVRCNWSTDSAASGGSSGSSSADLSLNRTDMTLGRAGETFTLKVTGASGSVNWSVGNSSVATVDASGKVTAVSAGSTTVTATVDGQTLKCIVRCSF